MAKNVMFQSTLSGSGKSLITAAVCRYLNENGYNVSPFKSLNISLNSYITVEGKEMGISQAFQSWACGKEPSHYMNPLLLKATGNAASQLIVNGSPNREIDRKDDESWDILTAVVRDAYMHLEKKSDIIVIEGSGTPAEINLKDIANMTTAEMFKAPVIMIGDIDTGGVFAGLFGTYSLLENRHKKLLKGFLINKFRGERSILRSGIKIMERELGVPGLGVISYQRYKFPEEDSLSLGATGKITSVEDDVRDVWLNNLDSFLDLVKRELRFDVLNKIIENGLS